MNFEESSETRVCTARGGTKGVKAVKKVVRFNEMVEVFEFEVGCECLTLVPGKYANIFGDPDDRRICRIARLTGCKTSLNMSTTRRNKHGEMCFMVTVKGNKDSDVERFKKLVYSQFPHILFTHA